MRSNNEWSTISIFDREDTKRKILKMNICKYYGLMYMQLKHYTSFRDHSVLERYLIFKRRVKY